MYQMNFCMVCHVNFNVQPDAREGTEANNAWFIVVRRAKQTRTSTHRGSSVTRVAVACMTTSCVTLRVCFSCFGTVRTLGSWKKALFDWLIHLVLVDWNTLRFRVKQTVDRSTFPAFPFPENKSVTHSFWTTSKNFKHQRQLHRETSLFIIVSQLHR